VTSRDCSYAGPAATRPVDVPALELPAAQDACKARVVKLNLFGGSSAEETGHVPGIGR
jgi:hypothetical protein